MILTVGAYFNKIPGSVGIGLDRGPATDAVMDMRRLEYDDGSVDAIYTFDAVEHVPLADRELVFSEFFRVLRDGGLIEVCTVDLEGICREYLAADPAKRRVLLHHFYGGQAFSGDFHLSGYDEDILRELLRGAGFEAITRTTPSRPWGGSLAMTAQKPKGA